MCACVCLCLSKGKSNLLARRVCVSRSPWTTLNSHLTCVYLPISTWADITSVVWSVEVEWMSRKCCGCKVLLKRKVFILSLQTADRSSDSPACLAVPCFKAVWTLGLCGKSEGSNSRAVIQTGVTAFAQLPLLSTCKAVDKVLLCWYCVILNLSLACKGSYSICFSDTYAGSLGTSLLFLGREHCNPVTLSTDSRAHLPMPAQLL